MFTLILCTLILNIHFMPGIFNSRTISDIPLLKYLVLSPKPTVIFPDSIENINAIDNIIETIIEEPQTNDDIRNNNKDININNNNNNTIDISCNPNCANKCGFSANSESLFEKCLNSCNCKYSKKKIHNIFIYSYIHTIIQS